MKILIAGDFVPRERVLEKIKKNDYADVFADLKPYIDQADYSILNLEAPLVLDSSRAQPIQKVGPSLGAPLETIDVIKSAGFNCVTLANNHIMDYGAQALKDTISTLNEKQILHVGAGQSLNDASKVLYLDDGAQVVAVVNFCENEFSIAGDNSAGAFPLSIVKNYHQIQEAKEGADRVVVIVHGGHELYQLPSPRMKELFHFFVEVGADAVINHHQHCYSGYEVYRGKPIFYGLGNLCFDLASRRNSIWSYGYFVMLSMEEEIVFEVVPYGQGLSSPGVKLQDREDIKTFVKEVKRLNDIIKDDNQLKMSFSEFVELKRFEMYYRLSHYHGKIMRYLFQHHVLKFKPGLQWALKISNLIDCDSQRDLISCVLKPYLTNDKD